MEPKNLGEVIKKIRVPVVAKACGLTPRAIYKWIDGGTLPRTDYTGETKYAQKIACASGGLFTAQQILDVGKHQVNHQDTDAA
ncbi:Cro/Cl family transcriptional regulator [Salmonella enterica]|uniref:Cro/Cl family transcriptional regulator n=1 Tax=Salmonella enterica TaxID=28901 RepID=A0A403N515_SALER|nr:Cro/Cl family transcriptional regulator [Salmonella enterica]EJO2709110.1 Cro/Cl family transcriptional regulator [Salmonella enterica]MLW03821.1 Cro/Cl family transcriptional regulator [Salmonella enterica]